MKIGDTLIIGIDKNIPRVPRKVVQKGSKGILVGPLDSIDLVGPPETPDPEYPIRLFFSFKDKDIDLWTLRGWYESSCRMVLTEKILLTFTMNEDELSDYLFECELDSDTLNELLIDC